MRGNTTRSGGPAGLTAALLGSLLLILAGCGGKASPQLDHALQDELNAGLPPLSSLRVPSGTATNIVLGTETFLRSSGGVEETVPPFVSPTSLRLDSSDGGHFEWAVYRINPSNPLAGAQVTLDSLDGGDEAFIALANYDLNAWEFSGPHTGASDTGTPEPDTGIFTLAVDEAVHRNPGGDMFVAVVAPAGSNIRVLELAVTSTTPDAPVADIQADVTSGEVPLLVTLDASGSTDADGSIVKYEWDTDGSGNFAADTGAVPTTMSSYATGGVFNVTVRVTDNDGLTSTASIEIVVTEGGNIPPIPVLIADQTEGDAATAFVVSFTSDQSEDRDGSIDLYEWDLDADATTGAGGFEISSLTPDPQLVGFNQPGDFRIRLRVTDNGGLQRIASVTITSHGWVQVPVEVGVSVLPGSLALSKIGKGPGFCYIDSLGTSLRFARATTETGDDTLDWSSVKLQTLTDGKSAAMSFVAGKPTIVFADFATGAVAVNAARHVSGNILDPANWGFTFTNIVMDALSTPLSIAEVDGNPAIAYSGTTFLTNVPQLNYARSATTTGADPADWQQVIIEPADKNLLLGGADLTVVDGRPAFISRPQNVNALRYYHSQTVQGLDPADWQFVDLPTDSSDRSSLALIDGNPAVCFTAKPALDTELHYLRASGASGDSLSDWGASAMLSSVTSVPPLFLDTGIGAQIVQADSQPVIAYVSNTFQTNAPTSGTSFLNVERSTTPGGELETDWSLTDQIDDASALNAPPAYELALAEINGRLCMAYWNSEDLEVVYAVHF